MASYHNNIVPEKLECIDRVGIYVIANRSDHDEEEEHQNNIVSNNSLPYQQGYQQSKMTSQQQLSYH